MNIQHFIVECLPVIVRVTVAIVQGPLAHWAFHRLAHLGIHKSIHRCALLGRLEHHFKWIPDVMMITALIGLHLATEAHSTGETAAGE
jgi:hypothetical protein